MYNQNKMVEDVRTKTFTSFLIQKYMGCPFYIDIGELLYEKDNSHTT